MIVISFHATIPSQRYSSSSVQVDAQQSNLNAPSLTSAEQPQPLDDALPCKRTMPTIDESRPGRASELIKRFQAQVDANTKDSTAAPLASAPRMARTSSSGNQSSSRSTTPSATSASPAPADDADPLGLNDKNIEEQVHLRSAGLDAPPPPEDQTKRQSAREAFPDLQEAPTDATILALEADESSPARNATEAAGGTEGGDGDVPLTADDAADAPEPVSPAEEKALPNIPTTSASDTEPAGECEASSAEPAAAARKPSTTTTTTSPALPRSPVPAISPRASRPKADNDSSSSRKSSHQSPVRTGPPASPGKATPSSSRRSSPETSRRSPIAGAVQKSRLPSPSTSQPPRQATRSRPSSVSPTASRTGTGRLPLSSASSPTAAPHPTTAPRSVRSPAPASPPASETLSSTPKPNSNRTTTRRRSLPRTSSSGSSSPTTSRLTSPTASSLAKMRVPSSSSSTTTTPSPELSRSNTPRRSSSGTAAAGTPSKKSSSSSSSTSPTRIRATGGITTNNDDSNNTNTNNRNHDLAPPNRSPLTLRGGSGSGGPTPTPTPSPLAAGERKFRLGLAAAGRAKPAPPVPGTVSARGGQGGGEDDPQQQQQQEVEMSSPPPAGPAAPVNAPAPNAQQQQQQQQGGKEGLEEPPAKVFEGFSPDRPVGKIGIPVTVTEGSQGPTMRAYMADEVERAGREARAAAQKKEEEERRHEKDEL